MPRLPALLIGFWLLSGTPGLSAQETPSTQQELLAFLQANLDKTDSFQDTFDAQVWLMSMDRRLAAFLDDPEERLELLLAVHREATLANLQPDLVLAVIEVESGFDRFALSSAGARGLMQVMPFWKRELGRPDDNLMQIDTNLRYGCRILQFYLQKEDGNLAHALARYNGSTGQTWYAERVMLAWQRRWYSGRL